MKVWGISGGRGCSPCWGAELALPRVDVEAKGGACLGKLLECLEHVLCLPHHGAIIQVPHIEWHLGLDHGHGIFKGGREQERAKGVPLAHTLLAGEAEVPPDQGGGVEVGPGGPVPQAREGFVDVVKEHRPGHKVECISAIHLEQGPRGVVVVLGDEVLDGMDKRLSPSWGAHSNLVGGEVGACWRAKAAAAAAGDQAGEHLSHCNRADAPFVLGDAQ